MNDKYKFQAKIYNSMQIMKKISENSQVKQSIYLLYEKLCSNLTRDEMPRLFIACREDKTKTRDNNK